MWEMMRARSVGRSSIGSEGFEEACDAVPIFDIVTGSMRGIIVSYCQDRKGRL